MLGNAAINTVRGGDNSTDSAVVDVSFRTMSGIWLITLLHAMIQGSDQYAKHVRFQWKAMAEEDDCSTLACATR